MMTSTMYQEKAYTVANFTILTVLLRKEDIVCSLNDYAMLVRFTINIVVLIAYSWY